jgi:hypothetical protein
MNIFVPKKLKSPLKITTLWYCLHDKTNFSLYDSTRPLTKQVDPLQTIHILKARI